MVFDELDYRAVINDYVDELEASGYKINPIDELIWVHEGLTVFHRELHQLFTDRAAVAAPK